MRLMPAAIGALVGAVVGALSMYLWMRAEPALPAGQTLVSPLPTGGATSVEADQLRRVVREELARHAENLGAQGGSRTQPAVDANEGAAVSPQNFASAERAHAVLDGAIARQEWTDADATALGAEMAGLSRAQHEVLMLKFAAAVNERGMKLNNTGPPF